MKVPLHLVYGLHDEYGTNTGVPTLAESILLKILFSGSDDHKKGRNYNGYMDYTRVLA